MKLRSYYPPPPLNTAIDLACLADLREFGPSPDNDNGAPNLSLDELFEFALKFAEEKRAMIKELMLQGLEPNEEFNVNADNADTTAEKLTELHLSLYINQINTIRKDLYSSLRKDPSEIRAEWETTVRVVHDIEIEWLETLSKFDQKLESIDPKSIDTALVKLRSLIQKKFIKAGLYNNGQKIREILENCGVSLD